MKKLLREVKILNRSLIAQLYFVYHIVFLIMMPLSRPFGIKCQKYEMEASDNRIQVISYADN